MNDIVIVINFVYVVVVVLFILGFKLFSYFDMVKKGNFILVIGMLVVVVVILFD